MSSNGIEPHREVIDLEAEANARGFYVKAEEDDPSRTPPSWRDPRKKLLRKILANRN